MAKKRNRVFDVSCGMQVIELTRAGSSIDLYVYEGGQKLGEVKLGRGSIIWTGKGKGQYKSIRLRWHKFAALMNGLASGDIKVRIPS